MVNKLADEFPINPITQQATNISTRDHVMQVLDWEIERAIAETTQPGWTTWAIYGALAAVIWTLLSEINQSENNTRNILFYFLVAQFTLDLLKQFSSVIAPQSVKKASKQRFFFSNILATSRYGLIIDILRDLSLIVIVKSYSQFLPDTVKYGTYFYYGLSVFGSVTALATSFLKWPLPIPRAKHSLFWILPSIGATLLLVPLVGCIDILKPGVNLPDLKVASLLTAVVFLLIVLMQKRTINPLLVSLIDLRRNLSFGNISLVDAINQADIAIAGMQLRDVLQEIVSDIISSFEKINAESDDVYRRMEELQRNWPEKWCCLTTEQRQNMSQNLTRAVETYKSIGKLVENNEARVKSFKKKMYWLETLLRSRPQEIDEVVIMIEKTENESREKFKVNLQLVLDLEKRLDEPCKHYQKDENN